MSVRSYTRLELAANQLEASIGLFISGRDRFSVISLAGAADVILSRLVINSGQQNFTESMLKEAIDKGEIATTREEFGKGMNDLLFINDLKHMDDDEDGYIEIDLEECALAAVLKALSNYVILAGRKDNFVKAFYAWMRFNLDPTKYNTGCDPN